MNDCCEIKTLNGVMVQENGIIRLKDGLLIARLTKDIKYEDLPDETYSKDTK